MISALSIKTKTTQKPTSLVKTMLRWRMQYYVYATADALKRNTQIAVLLVLVFGPMLIALMAAMAKPLLVLLQGSDFTTSLMLWSGFVTISLVWVALQKNALLGGLANQYLQTVPIEPKKRFLTDFAVLYSTNGILFIPYLIAIVYSLAQQNVQGYLQISLIVVWMFTVVLLQLQLLYRIRFFWLSSLASLLSPMSMCLFGSTFIAIFIAIGCIVVFYAMLQKNTKAKNDSISYMPSWLRLKREHSIQHNLIRLYLRQLLQKENRAQQMMLFVVMILPVFVLPLIEAEKILQNLLWIRWKEQGLFLFISSVLIALIVMQVSSLQMQLKTQFKAQIDFLQSHGICSDTLYKTQDRVLMLVGTLILVPVLVMIGIYLGILEALILSICVFIILISNILLYHFPEQMHVMAKLILFILSIVIIRFILGYLS